MLDTSRVMVITGGGTGIGRSMAEAFARGSDQVVIVGRRESILQEAAAVIGPNSVWQFMENLMRTSTSVALWIVRVTGLIQIVLGVLFWTGNALSLIPVHMISGLILVLSLWVLAFQAIQTGANSRLGIVAIIWGLLTAALGMYQGGLLPGPAHWIIQVLHLLVGIAAIGQAHGLAYSIREPRAYA